LQVSWSPFQGKQIYASHQQRLLYYKHSAGQNDALPLGLGSQEGILKVKKTLYLSERSEESRHYSLLETLGFTQGDSMGAFKKPSKEELQREQFRIFIFLQRVFSVVR
jgi:hypothetical protein